MGTNPKMIWLSNKLQCLIAINSKFTKMFFRMGPKSRKKLHSSAYVLGIYSCESPKKAAFPGQQVQNFNADFCTENSISESKHLLKYSNSNSILSEI